MHITEISVKNYKSLRNITINPKRLTLVVGANASGKSNLADCLDFISEVYRFGLETAVSRKRGFPTVKYID